MEMKKCKECGKLFVPKSARAQYCDGEHYRPCPVCGKLVYAKYLSDPARCCSRECSQKKNNAVSITNVSCKEISVSKEVRSLFTIPDSPVECVEPRKVVQKLSQLSPDSEFAAMLRETADVRTYTGVPVLGFIPGHEYALEINKDDRNILYIIEACYDFTEGKEVDHCIHMASKISIAQNFMKGA